MAAGVKIVMEVEIDGDMAPGFPIVRRLVTDEAQAFTWPWALNATPAPPTYIEVPGSGSAATPGMRRINAFLLRPTDTVRVAVNGQIVIEGAPVMIEAGGMMLMFDGELGPGGTMLSVANMSNSLPTIEGFIAGKHLAAEEIPCP